MGSKARSLGEGRRREVCFYFEIVSCCWNLTLIAKSKYVSSHQEKARERFFLSAKSELLSWASTFCMETHRVWSKTRASCSICTRHSLYSIYIFFLSWRKRRNEWQPIVRGTIKGSVFVDMANKKKTHFVCWTVSLSLSLKYRTVEVRRENIDFQD